MQNIAPAWHVLRPPAGDAAGTGLRKTDLDMGNISRPITARQRPIWQVALIALVVLLVISEVVLLLIAMVAKSSIDGGATAHDGLMGALSNAFFMYSASDNGPPVFMSKGFCLLPGFNTLYYLVFGVVEAQFLMPFITSGLAALLVAMFALVGYLTMAASRGVAMTLLFALLFAVSWVVLYTGAEASMFGSSFWNTIGEHLLEIPTAFISLLAVSFFARRRG
jgi:hypothetical protein